MAVLQDININVYAQPSDKRLRTFLSLSQNENGRLINFRILGSPLPSNCTAVFSGTKPDGTVYTTTGTVTGNFVIVQEDMQMTAVPGVWDANLDVVNGTHNIVTAIIRVMVERGTVAPGSVPSNSQLDGYVAQCKSYAEHARTDAYGSPLTATTAAEMTDKTRVYVYTGSESGMTAGNWYTWNGSAWVSGGVYNAVAVQTDTTLSVAGKAADGKATGDAIGALKEDLSDLNGTLIKRSYTWENDLKIGTQLYDIDNDSLIPSTYKQGYRVATLYTNPVYLRKGTHLHIPSNRAFRYAVSTDGTTYAKNTESSWLYGEIDYFLPLDGYYVFVFSSYVNGNIDTVQVGNPIAFVDGIEFTYAENKIVDDLYDAVIKYTSWANGSVRGTISISDSGWNIDNYRPTSRFTTDIDNPFYLYCGDEIICPTGYRMYVSWRDETGAYKKHDGWIVEGSFKAPENGYFALCISTKTDVNFSETFDAIIKRFTINTAKTVAERIYVNEKKAETETILYDGLLGGKLPFNEVDFENGSMTNGDNDNYRKQARARSIVIHTNNYNMTILTDVDWHMFVNYYDANGNYISGDGWLTGEYTIPKNTYYRLVFCLNAGDSTTRSVSEILSHFKMETYSDEDKESLPEYYFQNDYLSDKSALIRDNSVRNGITFAFITDVHVEINAGRSPMLLNYLLNHNNSIQGVLFGGDVPMDQATTAEVKAQGDKWTNWVSKIGKDKVYQCAGNHDYCGIHNSVWTGLSQNYIYNYVMGGQLLRIHAPALKKYYYFDVEPLKTRFVVLDNYDRAENEPTYANKVGVSYDQLYWLCNSALASIDGYHIIVVSHQNSDPNLSYYDSNLAVVRNLLVAFANKSTFSYDGLEKDFTNDTNTLVMHLAGHVHADESNFSDGVLSVNTTCDARYTGVYVDPNRVVGTISEQAFDVFSVDYDARTVKTVRIGYGSDRSLMY